jgi:hypothetical protein
MERPRVSLFLLTCLHVINADYERAVVRQRISEAAVEPQTRARVQKISSCLSAWNCAIVLYVVAGVTTA